jgi:hypothetical protein
LGDIETWVHKDIKKCLKGLKKKKEAKVVEVSPAAPKKKVGRPKGAVKKKAVKVSGVRRVTKLRSGKEVTRSL